MRRRIAALPIVALTLGLSGCGADTPFAGWIGRPAPQQAAPLYCYETLGDIDCYDRPDPQQRE